MKRKGLFLCFIVFMFSNCFLLFAWPPLHDAAKAGNTGNVIALINSEKFDVNEKASVGWTPLHMAARYGSHEMVNAILKAGGIKSLYEKTSDGWTALHLAARNGSHEMVSHFWKPEESEASMKKLVKAGLLYISQQDMAALRW